MKKCTKCNLFKPLFEYYKRNENIDGHHNKCIQCWKAASQKWYQNNKNAKLAKSREYRQPRKQQANEYAKSYRLKNPEKIKQDNIVWRNKNPEKVKELEHRRRARQKQNGEFYIRPQFLKRLYNSPCVACGSKKNITQDHIIPIARGGTHGEGNLQPLCKKCNSSKKDKFMSEWLLTTGQPSSTHSTV